MSGPGYGMDVLLVGLVTVGSASIGLEAYKKCDCRNNIPTKARNTSFRQALIVIGIVFSA